MKLEIYRKTYTWQIIREGGFNEDELEGLSEVRIGSAIFNQSKQSASGYFWIYNSNVSDIRVSI